MADIFDIIGPVMIGPSSSHTAGAVRMGNLAREILREDVRKAVMKLHGSFRLTWKGHGTDKALLAGLLGYSTDDAKIRDSYDLAKKENLEYEFIPVDLEDAFHPNSIYIEVWGDTRNVNILASSIGGGMIILDKVNGIKVHYEGESPTLVIVNRDTPGVAAHITRVISSNDINIEAMRITPNSIKVKDELCAVMVIGVSMELNDKIVEEIRNLDNVIETIFLNKLY